MSLIVEMRVKDKDIRNQWYDRCMQLYVSTWKNTNKNDIIEAIIRDMETFWFDTLKMKYIKLKIDDSIFKK